MEFIGKRRGVYQREVRGLLGRGIFEYKRKEQDKHTGKRGRGILERLEGGILERLVGGNREKAYWREGKGLTERVWRGLSEIIRFDILILHCSLASLEHNH